MSYFSDIQNSLAIGSHLNSSCVPASAGMSDEAAAATLVADLRHGFVGSGRRSVYRQHLEKARQANLVLQFKKDLNERDLRLLELKAEKDRDLAVLEVKIRDSAAKIEHLESALDSSRSFLKSNYREDALSVESAKTSLNLALSRVSQQKDEIVRLRRNLVVVEKCVEKEAALARRCSDATKAMQQRCYVLEGELRDERAAESRRCEEQLTDNLRDKRCHIDSGEHEKLGRAEARIDELEAEQQLMAGREADIAKCQQELEAFVREAETDITRREKVEEEQRCQLEAKTDIIRQLESQLRSLPDRNNTDDMREMVARLQEMESMQQSVLAERDDLALKVATFKTDSIGSIGSLTGSQFEKVERLVAAVGMLLQVINTQLEGETPSVALLLDSPQRRGDNNESVMEAVDDTVTKVSEIRSRIAERCAEKVGEDCVVQ